MHENAQPRGIRCTCIASVSWFDAITKTLSDDGDGGFRHGGLTHLQLQVKCPRRPLLKSNASMGMQNHAGIFAHVSPWLVGPTTQ